MTGVASDHLVVIGDSISSGLATRVLPWPIVLQGRTGVDVRNLSRPGALVTDGLAMAERVNADDRLVLIELGGNDLIAGGPSDVFAQEPKAHEGKTSVLLTRIYSSRHTSLKS